MSKETRPIIDQKLLNAWQKMLPTTLNEMDRAEVRADEEDPHALRIHIDTAGHTKYGFDFLCIYLDSREVKVIFSDVDKANRSIDEHTEIIQTLIEDYVRHIHECAQILQEITHA